MLNTIGYEGASPADFIQTLKVADVELVVDVRDRAQSRRPGFSKSALEQLLSAAGIGYLHLRELGDPKEGREAARAGNMRLFHQTYAKVLDTEAAEAALEQLASAVSAQSICLLCYERDHRYCHRKLVSDKLEAMTGNKARHLGVRSFEQARLSA